MENFKRSTSRDFRINPAALDRALNDQQETNDELADCKDKEVF